MVTRFERIVMVFLIFFMMVFYGLVIKSFAYSVIVDGQWVEMRNGTIVADDYTVAEADIGSDWIEIVERPEEAEAVKDEVAKNSEASADQDDIDTLQQSELSYLGEFTFTFYCSCRRCNGSWGAIDGFGNPLEWGCVAVDPSVIPLHTKLVVDGYDTVFEARDTGSGVDGKHIDMYVPVSHAEALKMGQGKKIKVWKVL